MKRIGIIFVALLCPVFLKAQNFEIYNKSNVAIAVFVIDQQDRDLFKKQDEGRGWGAKIVDTFLVKSYKLHHDRLSIEPNQPRTLEKDVDVTHPIDVYIYDKLPLAFNPELKIEKKGDKKEYSLTKALGIKPLVMRLMPGKNKKIFLTYNPLDPKDKIYKLYPETGLLKGVIGFTKSGLYKGIGSGGNITQGQIQNIPGK